MQSNPMPIPYPPFRRRIDHDDDIVSWDDEDSVPSFGSNPDSQHSSKSRSQGKDVSEVYQVAKEYSKDILIWRRLTFLVLFCTCAVLVGTIHHLLQKGDTDNDEEAVSRTIRAIQSISTIGNNIVEILTVDK
jgi:hypothetical protein